MAFSRLVGITLRLHFRNRMAVLYGHLFPGIVLLAFYGLYGHERAPLLGHLGELLTITALSGACFALPITMVRERERGVWRRYHLAPASLRLVLCATLLAHWLLLCLAGATQVALAIILGTPLPAHPVHLMVAFGFAAFAFLGIGLVLSALADTVNAAQALGQSVFLPMLVVGGVAVKVEALPAWAQALSVYLPGRYAVEAIQSSATGDGLGAMGFHLFALWLLGVTAIFAGAGMLRWGGAELRVPRVAKTGAAGAFAVWLLVGYVATTSGPYVAADAASAQPAPEAAMAAVRPPPAAAGAAVGPPLPADTALEDDVPPTAVADETAQEPWPTDSETITLRGIDRDIDYSNLPPDDGLVAPFARADEMVPGEVSDQLECMRMMIPGWGPAHDADPIQRVRNYLYIAAVPDVYQTGELERWTPLLVTERLQREFEVEELARTLHWIATHPAEGDLSAADELHGVCFERGAPSDTELLRERVTFYALKILGRTTGRLPLQ